MKIDQGAFEGCESGLEPADPARGGGVSPSEIFSALDVAAIGEAILTHGYVCLPALFSRDQVAVARAQALAAVTRNGGEYVAIVGADDLEGALLSDLAELPAFRAFCARLYTTLSARAAPPVTFHQVLRCLFGRSAEGHAHYHHYDSYVVTALAPVAIPHDGPSGDLILHARPRPIRRSYAANLLEKAVHDLRPVQAMLRWRARRGWRQVRVRLEPGSLYLFCGYRTLHTNEGCAPDRLRATLLLHYGNPHDDSRLRRWLGRFGKAGRRATGVAPAAERSPKSITPIDLPRWPAAD